MSHSNLRAFTLIELLVVIAIIVILAGLIVPALTGLKDRQRELQAGQDLQGFTLAISQYLLDYGQLGETDASFKEKPLHYLTAVPNKNLRPMYFNADSKRMARSDGGAISRVDQAEVMLDPWGEPYRIAITTDSIRGVTAVESVMVYTFAGTDEITPRARGRLLTVRDGEWRELVGDEVDR